MHKRTAFFHDERCLWHSGGMHALMMPVGGWIQPPSGAGHAESPDSKRRFKSLLDVTGLSERLAVSSAPQATEEDLLRIHPQSYLRRFKEVSDAGGGDLGKLAPFGRASRWASACWRTFRLPSKPRVRRTRSSALRSLIGMCTTATVHNRSST